MQWSWGPATSVPPLPFLSQLRLPTNRRHPCRPTRDSPVRCCDSVFLFSLTHVPPCWCVHPLSHTRRPKHSRSRHSHLCGTGASPAGFQCEYLVVQVQVSRIPEFTCPRVMARSDAQQTDRRMLVGEWTWTLSGRYLLSGSSFFVHMLSEGLCVQLNRITRHGKLLARTTTSPKRVMGHAGVAGGRMEGQGGGAGERSTTRGRIGYLCTRWLIKMCRFVYI